MTYALVSPAVRLPDTHRWQRYNLARLGVGEPEGQSVSLEAFGRREYGGFDAELLDVPPESRVLIPQPAELVPQRRDLRAYADERGRGQYDPQNGCEQDLQSAPAST